MADKKITQLNENTSPAAADLLALVNDVAGSPETQKITLENFLKIVDALTELSASPALTDTLLVLDSGTPKKVQAANLGGLTINVETLSAGKVLTDTDYIFQLLDPDGTDRDITLPAEASSNHPYYIINTGSTYDLLVQDDGSGNTIRLNPQQMLSVVPNLSDGWRYYKQYGVALIPTAENGYVIGGGIFDVDEYNPDAWTSKTNMPSPHRSQLAASTIEGAGYSYCGSDGSGGIQDTEEYVPDTWTSKSNAPSPARYALAASTIGAKGYIYAGTDGSPLQDTDEYDPDTWSNKATIPSPARYLPTATSISTKGYLMAGYGGGNLQDTDEYSPNTWSSKTNMPSPGRYTATASTIGSYGYIFGGTDGSAKQDTDQYTPDTWTSKTNMPSPARQSLGSSTIVSAIYLYAGSDGSSTLQDTDEYNPDTWTSKSNMPSPARSYIAGLTI